ncbi:MAG: hypothetical protein WKF48_03985 [Solirubrobacteraceae bacterium]
MASSMEICMSYIRPKWLTRHVTHGRAGSAVTGATMTIRLARAEDRQPLRDLAAVDSARPLAGAVLVAIVEGRLCAAYGLDDERTIADPFVPSAQAVGLLCLRARQMRAASTREESRWMRKRALARDGELRNS